MFGIEAIGLEIENPFGYDANDIPLDNLCSKLHNDIEELIAADEDAIAALPNSRVS